MNAFAALYASTQPSNTSAFSERPYIDPNVLRYYVLLHDQSAEGGASMEESKAILELVKKTYGLNCCILPFNSASQADGSATTVQSEVQKLWHQPIASTRRPGTVTAEDEREAATYGQLLDADDIDRLRAFVREMVAQSLVPWMERCVSHWNDSLSASRKGLTGRLFGAGRKFFGSNSSSSSSKATTAAGQDRPGWNAEGNFYPASSLEAQTRRLADFAFMTRDYKLAAAMYDIGRRDYATEKAHQYAAGATEMFGLSHLMLMIGSNAPPIDVDSYLALACTFYRATPVAAASGALLRPLRATLLYCEAYRALNFYRPAPAALLRAAEDPGADLEVMGAMLLEQAALADLKISHSRPFLRKWALHLIMAGHRYRQCGAKALSLRCYNAARAVYSDTRPRRKQFDAGEDAEATEGLGQGKDISNDATGHDDDDEEQMGWSLTQTHVEHEIGQQLFNDGHAEAALEHFLRTIRPRHQEPVAQSSTSMEPSHDFQHEMDERYLQDLLSAYRSLDNRQELPAVELPYPLVDVQKTEILLDNNDDDHLLTDGEAQTRSQLEQRFLNSNKFNGNAPTSLRGDSTVKSIGLNQALHPTFRISNPLSTSLTITEIAFDFADISNPSAEAQTTAITVTPTEQVTLNPLETRNISTRCHPSQQGRFRCSSLRYLLAGEIPIVQPLNKRGPRLHATREHRTSRKPMYAEDQSLTISVQSARPMLQVQLVEPPTELGLGEEREVTIRLTNPTEVPLKQVKMLTAEPDTIFLKQNTSDDAQKLVSNTIEDNLSVAILEALGQGETVEKTLLLRGATIGQLSALLLFVYEHGPTQYSRVYCQHVFEVYPTLEIDVQTEQSGPGYAHRMLVAVSAASAQEANYRVDGISLVSSVWQVSPKSALPLDAAFEALPAGQTSTTAFDISESMQDGSGTETSGAYTTRQLADLLQGRSIDRRSRAPDTALLKTHIGSTSPLSTSPFLPAARTAWRRAILAGQFSSMTSADRDRIFSLYPPDDIDVLVHWSALDGSRKGQVFFCGLRPTPRSSKMDEIARLAGVSAGRSMYEETAKAKAVLLDSLAKSREVGAEDEPLVVTLEVGSSDSSSLIPVTFQVTNLSTSRFASCIIDLDSSIQPLLHDGSTPNASTGPATSLAPPQRAQWVGRLTLRSPVKIPPRGTLSLNAKAQLSKDSKAKSFELPDWSIKTDVFAAPANEEVEEDRLVQRFNSGRIRNSRVYQM